MRTTLSKENRSTHQFEKTDTGLIRCEDGLLRPEWAAAPGLLRDYYDTEWGVPTHDEREIFERLCLEAFQSGLSWLTILKRRDAFRTAFSHFEPDVVAALSDADLEDLMKNEAIIRNQRKIEAVRTNAKATVRLRDNPDSPNLVDLVWSYTPKHPRKPRSIADLHPTSTESIALSKRLKKEGFAFVGPTTAMSTLEAIGVIDMHVEGAFSPVSTAQ
ncbi:MAG: DNA-3-methyladenine glycosylase I [Bifidobacteriaceae bacterium]|jgi:DNA-3-methyladenine glycosylase I|nr:DNA-3-methyladenine glycosylase I [Bifidobacteriaceae bacterium]MCI1914878.1 DNA-3-methyladenine glycosylase I [Bifidobacteriaceae bacterium]